MTALQEVFALLADGDALTVDTEAFVTAARVDALEQADATEFSALLLDWLQRELNASAGGGDFIPQLFEGELSRVLACNEDSSHTFEQRERFMELRACLWPVVATLDEAAKLRTPRRPSGKKVGKSLPTVRLEQLLSETAFPDEVLNGANKYHCEKCDRKVDARRTTRLSKLPPYLHVTVERYHYDLVKGERRRLSHPVSFPHHLEMRLKAPPFGSTAPVLEVKEGEPVKVSDVATTPPPIEVKPAIDEESLPVAYECIGYLEHVSDSAHSGHYRAILLREEEDECLQALCREAASTEAAESPMKRLKTAEPSTSRNRRCSWWTMDDDNITPVTWNPDSVDEETGTQTQSKDECTTKARAAQATSAAVNAPERIESQTAYLVLYRRKDHTPGSLPGCDPAEFTQSLASFVASRNGGTRKACTEFASKSQAIQRFTNERRYAVMRLADTLKRASSTLTAGALSDFSFVPTEWLEKFLHGEDRSLNDISGDASVFPPIYGRTLLRLRGLLAIDPLAVWCGEVKLLPTEALMAVGGAHGGLDASMFLPAQGALSAEAAQTMIKAFKIWCREQTHIARVLEDGRLSVSDARTLDSQGKGAETAWVSLRVHNIWRKAAARFSATGSNSLRAQWKAYLHEVQLMRYGRSSLVSNSSTEPAQEDEEDEDANALDSSSISKQHPCEATPALPSAELRILGGLICGHERVCRQRAAVVVRRAELQALLEVSAEKERAFAELWPEAPPRLRPRLRSGLPDGRLLAFNDVCTECRIVSTPTPATAVPAAQAKLEGRRVFAVRRKYASGTIRKQGSVTVALSASGTITASAVRAAIESQLKMPVLRLHLPGVGGGPDIELKSYEVISEEQDTVVAEKDEVEREGTAFNNSVFMSSSFAVTASAASSVEPTAMEEDSVKPEPVDHTELKVNVALVEEKVSSAATCSLDEVADLQVTKDISAAVAAVSIPAGAIAVS